MESFREQVNKDAMDDLHSDLMDFDVDFDGIPQADQPPHAEEVEEEVERRTRIEEVEDEDRIWMRFIQSYPGQVATTLGEARSMFHSIRAEQEALGLDPWAPFADEEEWGLVKWLIARVGQTAIDEFLKLPIVSRHSTLQLLSRLTIIAFQTSYMKPSFKSKYTLMKAIDKLPHRTEWKLKRITVEGNLLMNGQPDCEELELWLRDPVDCIRELFGNPEFNGTVSYAPERVFVDEEGKTRRFDEMWTGDWWWEMQVSWVPPFGV